MANIQIPRGTKDILPEESGKWQAVERAIHSICRRYRYREIRTPLFEHTELFQRSVGDTTDIVQKEMYTFTDRGDRSLTLRPEGTAPVVRSFVEHKLFGQPDQPVKLYYTGPMFRYERPQAGRFRQFVQFGVEAIGAKDAALDAEVIALAFELYRELGLRELHVVLNSLGDADSRQAHRSALVAHFEPHIDEFCGDCQKRLHQNPLRILDCKADRGHPLIETAPKLPDYYNEETRAYFEEVQSSLSALGIPYVLDPAMVRGLDYYNDTAFEIMTTGKGFGTITTLAGGGRYNGLVEDLGGPESPGIGFALSIERLLLALESEGVELPVADPLDAYVVAMGDEAKRQAAICVQQLRQAGFSADMDYGGRKVKGQLKSADRLQARYVVLIGEEELAAREVTVKALATRRQQRQSFAEFLRALKEESEQGEML